MYIEYSTGKTVSKPGIWGGLLTICQVLDNQDDKFYLANNDVDLCQPKNLTTTYRVFI